ncbi:MAG: TonB-dependent receptor plug domain-containing protein, partial [Saprospiraceae bacterium]|nr:TonB-dependent receptor plug domain-containing protein [Saprospiraceae bacterium]
MFHRLAFVWLALTLSCTLFGQYTIPDENLVNYSCEDKSLREVLSEVGANTGVTIAFQEEILPSDSIVSISVRNQRLGKFLEYLIAPHKLRYKIVGNQIVIKRNPYVSSGEKITISGYLKDAESGEPLVNANVYLYDKTQGTTTNEYGFYSFTIDKGVQRVYYSYLGYDLGIKEYALSADTTANVKLKGTNQLSEIVIKDSRIVSSNRPEELYPVDVLNLKTLNSTVALGGEVDVIRATQNLAGVTSGADGFGGMSVRGGETNQNLILYDGIPIYNADHAFGLFSIFNSTLIKSASLYKGAFPSHYSGRLSSVLDIRTREGNNQKFQGDVSLGLLALKASIEGPIKKDKSSFLFSFRRTFVDPWIKSLTEYINEQDGKNGSSSVFFFDFNGKMNFKLGERSHLYLSYYSGNDSFNTETTELSDDQLRSKLDQNFWDSGNKLASIRWNFQLSKKAFLNFSVYQTQYQFTSFDHDRTDILESGMTTDNFYDAGFYQSKIKDNGARVQLELTPNTRHKIKLGAGAIRHSFEPGLILVDNFDNITSNEEYVTKNQLNLLLDEPNIKGNEYEFFVEDEIKFGKYTYLNLGLNYMLVDVGTTFALPQPRILFTTGSEKYKLKMAWSNRPIS